MLMNSVAKHSPLHSVTMNLNMYERQINSRRLMNSTVYCQQSSTHSNKRVTFEARDNVQFIDVRVDSDFLYKHCRLTYRDGAVDQECVSRVLGSIVIVILAVSSNSVWIGSY